MAEVFTLLRAHWFQMKCLTVNFLSATSFKKLLIGN